MREDALLTGVLEPTNEPYAIAKIAGIKLCESYNRQHGTDYRSVMPTNLYGPGDNFHPQNSHVLPALIRRFHEAAQAGADEVTIWGTGSPRREFLHVDDMAEASLFVFDLPREDYDRHARPMLSHVNIGCGEDIAILELARMVAAVVGFKGEIRTDPSKPDGAPRKLMDVSLLGVHGLGAEHSGCGMASRIRIGGFWNIRKLSGPSFIFPGYVITDKKVALYSYTKDWRKLHSECAGTFCRRSKG